MKLHVKHNHDGFVFDKVCKYDDIPCLAKEINKVIKAFAALECDKSVVSFEIDHNGSVIKKSLLVESYREADKEMDKFVRGLEYIWPEMAK